MLATSHVDVKACGTDPGERLECATQSGQFLSNV